MAEDLPPWCGELELFPSYRPLFNTNLVKRSLGDPCGGGTPGYIPNPVVKPASADGTALVAGWESRSSPRDFFLLFAVLKSCTRVENYLFAIPNIYLFNKKVDPLPFTRER